MTQATDHILLDIFELAKWHHFEKKVPVTSLMFQNWIGSYYTHFQVMGGHPIAFEFHQDVCKGVHRFEKYTSRVPFLEEIVGHSLGCVLFSYQPLEIFARATNQTREQAFEDILQYAAEGEKFKYVQIIQWHFQTQYGIFEDEFNILQGILGLNQFYKLPQFTECEALADEIIDNHFKSEYTGLFRRIYTD